MTSSSDDVALYSSNICLPTLWERYNVEAVTPN